VDTKLKTGIAESLREPLMKIVQKLLFSDTATFEQLTTPEQNLWTRFETGDIYRFLTGEEDTVPEFQYNWTSIPRIQPLGPTETPTPAPAQAPTPPEAPPAVPPAPVAPPDTSSSGSSSSSSPHSSQTPSTLGTQPKQHQPTARITNATDPSGASTSGTTASPPGTTT
jgi:hypothetical protein